jgi:CrcB protein
MKMLLIVGLGGGLGSIARYVSQRAVALYLPVSFPYGTFFINILGSFLIGIIFGISEKSNILSPEIRLFLTMGFCGGFTTFSSFSLDSLMLIRDAQYLNFGLYAGLSVFLGLAATIAGIAIVKLL